ncbi:MAG: FkbM family methyltransferase, partial [Bacteroidota bacterium]
LRHSHPLIHRPLKLVYALSAWCFAKGFGRTQPKQVITNLDGTGKLLIDPSRNMGASIYWTGFHEFRELLFLHHYLKPDMVLVDAGANIGLFTVFAARRLNSGTVIAFEPVPSMARWLEENITINRLNNVIIAPCGLSDAAGVLPIYEIESSHEGLSTLYPGTLEQSSVTEVPVKRLDDLFSSYGTNRLDFIKIDIEGGELPALRGATECLKKFRPAVMVEINQGTYASAGYTPADVYEFFRSLDYRPYEITRTGALVPESGVSVFSNIVFLPA